MHSFSLRVCILLFRPSDSSKGCQQSNKARPHNSNIWSVIHKNINTNNEINRQHHHPVHSICQRLSSWTPWGFCCKSMFNLTHLPLLLSKTYKLSIHLRLLLLISITWTLGNGGLLSLTGVRPCPMSQWAMRTTRAVSGIPRPSSLSTSSRKMSRPSWSTRVTRLTTRRSSPTSSRRMTRPSSLVRAARSI